MSIVCVDPTTDRLWERVVSRYRASLFHSPLWIRVLRETYGFDARAYVLLNTAEEPVAGIPVCRISDPIGERIVSLPFSDYCGPLFEDKAGWQKLFDRLSEHGVPVTIRCLDRSVLLADKRLTIAKTAKWHSLSLEPDLDAIWNGMEGRGRTSIRKALADGVTVEVASKREVLEEFYRMHARIRKHKYRFLAQPYRFFENIWNCFLGAESLYLLIARYQGELIAGALFLGSEHRLYYKFNASDPRYLRHAPNNLLVWEGIKLARNHGYKALDFGLSDFDQGGLIKFKRQFGAEEREIFFLEFLPENMGRRLGAEMRGLLEDLTRLLTDESVPDRITAQAGDVLYKFFA